MIQWTLWKTCHPGHTKCLDNTCVLDTLVCMHAGCNPGLCSFTLRATGRKVTDAVFCANHCTPLACSCGPLFFQCSSGDCISLSKFINVEIHDCIDASDEIDPNPAESQNTLEDRYDEVNNGTKFFSCNNGDILPLHNIDDLIPDCPGDDSEDEPVHWSLVENVNIRPYTLKCFIKISFYLTYLKTASILFPKTVSSPCPG